MRQTSTHAMTEALEARRLMSAAPAGAGLAAKAVAHAESTLQDGAALRAVVVADLGAGAGFKHPDLYKNVWID